MYFQTRPLTGPGTGASSITALFQLKPDVYPYMLASTATGNNSRFDILFAHPQQSLELNAPQTHKGGPVFLESVH
jgi:hypothetical protein